MNRIARPIEVEFLCNGTRHEGRIEDLSEGGMYIYTGLSWHLSTDIELQFELPDGDSTPIQGRGTIVWTDSMGFGVSLAGLDAIGRERLRRFIKLT